MEIQVLSKETIDRIAAGEVVERPASVIKELVENSIDAGSTYVTVEIKFGGIEFIRVTDNGCGIETPYIHNAFLRHATSKIQDSEDLNHISTLGFRGEALSSICAVARCEVITKTKEELTGIRYINEGGAEVSIEEIGCPDGTTMIVRNLFYNVPVRRKFLKSATSEGAAVGDLMEHLALSNPQISFQFINNGKTVFSTSGNNNLREVIYRIYGKDVVSEMVPLSVKTELFEISGYIGKPEQHRSNRNQEVFFINGRYVKNDILSKSVEEGYKTFLMQHSYPICVLNMEIAPEEVDVNVHPTKMEIRFINSNEIFFTVSSAVYECLHNLELIPNESLDTEPKKVETCTEKLPQAFETNRIREDITGNSTSFDEYRQRMEQHVLRSLQEPVVMQQEQTPIIKAENQIVVENPIQMNMFDDKLLTRETRKDIHILGQIFQTFWLLTFEDKLFIVDQHAAHEKVKYESFMKAFKESSIVSQDLSPAIIMSLTSKEKEILNEYHEEFTRLGFYFEEYGGNEIKLISIPYELFGYSPKEMFLSTLDELAEGPIRGDNSLICSKIASMSCKAAVKGNHTMTFEEMETLMDELLELEDPYHCPHGRPTIISMTKYEIEKKFKRIV